MNREHFESPAEPYEEEGGTKWAGSRYAITRADTRFCIFWELKSPANRRNCFPTIGEAVEAATNCPDEEIPAYIMDMVHLKVVHHFNG